MRIRRRRGLLALATTLGVALAACGRAAFEGGGPAGPTPTPTGTAFANPTAPPALADWTRRRHVLVSADGIQGTLTGFPVPLTLGTQLDGAASGGADLRIVDETGAQLPYEIEVWSSGAAPSLVWVRAPPIAPAAGASFWLYWGNPQATAAQSAVATFGGTFAAVWHLDPSVRAATGPANDVTTNSTNDAPGILGRARGFDGTANAILDVPDNPSLDFTGALTISAWIHATDWNGNRRILQKGDNDDQYRFLRDGGAFKLDMKNVGTVQSAVPGAGQWHHVASTWDGAVARLYVDGTQVQTANTGGGGLQTTANPLHIGAKIDGGTAGDHFAGALDEVRISPVARSADWIRLEYDVVQGNAVTIGPEEKR